MGSSEIECPFLVTYFDGSTCWFKNVSDYVVTARLKFPRLDTLVHPVGLSGELVFQPGEDKPFNLEESMQSHPEFLTLQVSVEGGEFEVFTVEVPKPSKFRR